MLVIKANEQNEHIIFGIWPDLGKYETPLDS
jgi:hypothetical protein